MDPKVKKKDHKKGKQEQDKSRKKVRTVKTNAYVVVQFYPGFNFDFPLFFSMLIYDNEYQTKENQN